MIRAVDWVAHLLHTPTMLGRRHARHRWHHRIHLISESVLGRVCDAYERRLGVTEAEMHQVADDWAEESLRIAEDTVGAFAELDTTEDQFDAMMAAGTPVEVAAPIRSVGYRCEHMTMTTGAVVTLTDGPPPAISGPCWHGCTLEPVYATEAT